MVGPQTEEARKKLSETRKHLIAEGKIVVKGHPVAVEAKAALLKWAATHPHPMLGRHHSMESIEKNRLSQPYLGKKMPAELVARQNVNRRVGVNHPNALWLKLSIDELHRLLEEYKTSGLPIDTFAKKYGGNGVSLARHFRKHFPAKYDAILEEKQSMWSDLYQKGREFEYRVRDFYRTQGYFVLRSPRSKGPADLVALKKGETLLIQCKMGGKLPKNGKEKLIALAQQLGAQAMLASNDFKHHIVIKPLTE